MRVLRLHYASAFTESRMFFKQSSFSVHDNTRFACYDFSVYSHTCDTTRFSTCRPLYYLALPCTPSRAHSAFWQTSHSLFPVAVLFGSSTYRWNLDMFLSETEKHILTYWRRPLLRGDLRDLSGHGAGVADVGVLVAFIVAFFFRCLYILKNSIDSNEVD